MGWGSKALDQSKVREALLTQAAADLTGNLGRANEKTYLAALYAEQVRTNELLEELVRPSSPVAP
jgi:hypothetical protein